MQRLDRKMLGRICSLAWPTMLEQIMQTAVQYIDTAMVGTLGTVAVAAVGATTTLGWLFSISVSALGVGFLSHISHALGAGDETRAKKTASQSILVSLLVGSFLTLLALALSGAIPALMQIDPIVAPSAQRYFFILYTPMLFRTAQILFSIVLRAAGDSRTPMKVGLIVNLTNVLLNFLLIYPTREVTLFQSTFTVPGADLGVEGAALASALAFALGGILTTAALFSHPKISPKGLSLKPDRAILLPCLKVSLPSLAQGFATALGYVVFASIINSAGGTSTAAQSIANTVESAFYIPGFGMQSAAATLAGNAYGARDSARLKQTARMFLPLEICLMILSGGALFLLAGHLVRLFSEDPEVIRLGTTVLQMVSVTEPFYGVSIVVEGLLQGVGRTRIPFLYNLVGMWGVRIVGTFVCIRFFSLGLVGAWSCMIAHNLLLFILFVRAYRKGLYNPLDNPARRPI